MISFFFRNCTYFNNNKWPWQFAENFRFRCPTKIRFEGKFFKKIFIKILHITAGLQVQGHCSSTEKPHLTRFSSIFNLITSLLIMRVGLQGNFIIILKEGLGNSAAPVIIPQLYDSLRVNYSNGKIKCSSLLERNSWAIKRNRDENLLVKRDKIYVIESNASEPSDNNEHVEIENCSSTQIVTSLKKHQ